MTSKKIRTRIAPSPTGMLHIGGLRTALYNYLFAKQNSGEFFLRIEDTDRTRFVEGATEKVMEMLQWTGLQWDNRKVMVQSERLGIYKKYAQQLIDSGHAYYCFCTPAELAKEREEQKNKGELQMYSKKCRKLQQHEIQFKSHHNIPHTVRLKVPEKIGHFRAKENAVIFKDLVWGNVKFYVYAIDDQVLIKSDGYPTYHLAVVVDDHEMGITHVLRGEDWLPSTPKHVLLYEAFGWELPVFCHLPNILGENKKKLSKRTSAISVEDFKNQGYLPEALINYLAFLGWNPGTQQEIFKLEELVKAFDIKKINKSGAIFDIKKLANINGQYLRQLKVEKLKNLCLPYLEKTYGEKLKEYSDNYIENVIATEQERLKKLSEISENTKLFFVDELSYDVQLLIWKKSDAAGAKKSLVLMLDFLKKQNDWKKDSLAEKSLAFIKEQNLTNGEVLWPLRVALSGQQNSPGPLEIAAVLGKEKTLTRIEQACEKLK